MIANQLFRVAIATMDEQATPGEDFFILRDGNEFGSSLAFVVFGYFEGSRGCVCCRHGYGTTIY
jgi:hypothetical protein